MCAFVKNQYVLRGKDQDCVITTYIPKGYFAEAIDTERAGKAKEDALIDAQEKAAKEDNSEATICYGRYTSGHHLQLVYTRAVAKFICDMLRSENCQEDVNPQMLIDPDIATEFSEFFSVPTGFLYSSGTWNYNGIDHFLHAMKDQQSMYGETFDIRLQLNMIRIAWRCPGKRGRHIDIPHAPAGRVPTYMHFYEPGEFGEMLSFGEVML